ncbi:hypothetical protein [Oceanidesulfovibrio marinus]|uniref:hypothetical protein n=1 Tax=Oceanidesulfovibrio marinus TaxID=370038 RepID=UPI0012947C50|nr:hypothetical protein [Oceanidesulfovibrio marinus]
MARRLRLDEFGNAERRTRNAGWVPADEYDDEPEPYDTLEERADDFPEEDDGS